MIETYFTQLEQIIQAFPSIRTYTLQKKIYGSKQGYISGSLLFNNGYRLDFVEVKDIDRASKIKYRYQYMDEQDACIFRYDNAPHHLNIATFPHHNHLGEQVEIISEKKSVGQQKIELDCEGLPSGIYFCTLKTSKGIQTTKMIKL